ncbi:SGNH/GDSL hydrolase family protein [Azospirillum rugosum]|uniref:SGNH hydrolase-type esterase domain-containing protein n=1 Tax=Azospirillum rugosum TaxID=416170 RepID=A0ABS4SP24_9PROT|nr:hypothetical protein [Azospirillum rugosum]MBP2294309.1 hypothetical protein [Azospirillum rugosum]MDQ0527644.1 hypothetical protein [Azospirillum rugosum]
MKILILPDRQSLDRPGAARMVQAVRSRFGQDAELVFGTTPEQAAAFPDLPATRLPRDTAIGDSSFTHWVLALSILPVFEGWESVDLPGDAATREGKALFMMEPDGFLHPLYFDASGRPSTPITAAENPHIEQNIFIRMAPRTERGSSYFFPYATYFSLMPSAFGPVNEFGLRLNVDLRSLETRDPDHRVVVVLGGSSAWSPCCLHEEMFPSLLEERLNAHSRDRGLGTRFTVLNMALPGNTVLNQIITYVLFCHRLNPDIVLTYDGFNDLANGIQTDPHLLNQHDITYLPEWESWAKALMGAKHVSPLQPTTADEPIRVLNGPEATVRAFLARKRQLMRMVRDAGAAFVWGIQPSWFGKEPSPQEHAMFERIRKLWPRALPLYAAMPRLYELVRKHQNVPDDGNLVDVHAHFGGYGADATLFVDHAHLTPAGDRIVADLFFTCIAERILPNLGPRRAS